MIFEYHSIIPDTTPLKRRRLSHALRQTDFERQVRWLKDRFEILPLDKYLAGSQGTTHKSHNPAALTFDDGYQLSFEIVSTIILRLKIPATFFVSTAHLEHGKLLWFSYLKALCFENLYSCIEIDHHLIHMSAFKQRQRAWTELLKMARKSRDPQGYCAAIANKYPIPNEIAKLYFGMTADQLRSSASQLIEFGAHTHSHPYLDQLPRELQEIEINQSKQILSECTGEPVRYFAYPSGAYNIDTVELVKAAGFQAAFAEIPKQLGDDWRYEIPRTGVYSPSLLKLWLKTKGASGLFRRIGIQKG